MQLLFFTSGYIKTQRHRLVRNAPPGIPFTVPVPFYLIHHPQGTVLFDCGQKFPPREYHPDAPFIPELTARETAKSLLDANGITPTHLVISHRHSDHIGGLDDFPEIKCFIQRAEAEVPAMHDKIKQNPNQIWHTPDGEYDLFGDGKIILLPTPGHTAGHQSLLLNFPDGRRLILAVDAAYTREALTDLPGDGLDAESPYWRSITLLNRFAAGGVGIITGHDPVAWQKICPADGTIY